MKNICVSLALAALAAPALAGTQVGVSIDVHQPGFYGRVDIGRIPAAPVLVYPSPVLVTPGPVAVVRRPVYLHVPPGHARHWHKHCGRYDACAQPVYFVQDDWYRKHHTRHSTKRHRHPHDD